jgi:hypothetical protein
MKFDYSVVYDGRFYRAGMDVPVPEAKAKENNAEVKPEENSTEAQEQKPKTKAKKTTA